MKTINIGGKDYTLKYSIQASMHSECTEKVTVLMARLGETQSRQDIFEFFKGFSDVPATAMHMLYAGLIENHGVRGDRTVMEFGAVYDLVEQYFEEHKEDGKGNFYELLMFLLSAMGEDGFFEKIGLESVMDAMTLTAKKAPKVPQDHKKKTTKKTTRTTPEVTEK